MNPAALNISAAAHPRVGGENSSLAVAQVPPTGSSPRGRGKRRFLRPSLALLRLIPAWAGKTVNDHAGPVDDRAHPRVGGENVIGTFVAGFKTGSSPRGRGKQVTVRGAGGSGGLIPAWAGKTPRCQGVSGARAAHPRVGGENMKDPSVAGMPAGSSPRGRGKLDRPEPPRPGPRLIPAWAGKTDRRPHHR